MNEKRNWKIYFEWVKGKDYAELAGEFSLSRETIKEICMEKVPMKVRQSPWQRANSYKKFREFRRKTLKEPNSNL